MVYKELIKRRLDRGKVRNLNKRNVSRWNKMIDSTTRLINYIIVR